MNLKLALAYDKDNAELRKLLTEIEREEEGPAASGADANAMALFREAGIEEARNNIDRAIELLERALALSKQAELYNRLGVILATRKREVARGRELIMKAIELEPANKTYRHNLEKLAPASR
jgi:Flp pilus assembly protein TadD